MPRYLGACIPGADYWDVPVAQQTREIAIRMALGASRGAVLRRTLRYALMVATAGVAGGLIVSIGLTRFLSSLLYGVKPLDWVVVRPSDGFEMFIRDRRKANEGISVRLIEDVFIRGRVSDPSLIY